MILDVDDQIRLLKQLLDAENIDEKRWPARVLAGLIDHWKNRGLTPDQVPAGESAAFANGRGKRLYQAFQERLKILNAADFGDLLLECLRLWREHPDVLREYQNRFRYMLVDEYQDTNVAQYLWLRLIAQARRNLCCVGDDDQSIYSWRGAEVANILRFEKDFPGATIIRLEQNYRSTSHILAAADGLIAHNAGRLGKTLWTEAGDGEKVRVIGVWDGPEEARRVGEDAEGRMRSGGSLDDIGILVRAQFQTDHAVGVAVHGGEQDHRHLAGGAQFAAQGEAVVARHHHVQQHHVDRFGGHALGHAAAVAGLEHAHAVLAQEPRQHGTDGVVVVDDQDGGRGDGGGGSHGAQG